MERAVPSNLIGKIKSVCCEDFVTYKSCSFHPTEYLNIIIGPNGTGKSTIVSAIVLGLGGEAKLLSRASNIESYIRNGSDRAIVKVEIYVNNDGKTVVFQRSFGKDGKSEYRINGEASSKNKLLQAVAHFNVDISNLCQFLPQDRVQDFAKMNPQEIFRNTISSVCSQNILEEFSALKELRKKQIDKGNNNKTNVQKLQEFTARVEELEQILRSYDVLKVYQNKLDACSAKKVLLEIEELNKRMLEQKNELMHAHKSLKIAKGVHDEYNKKYNAIIQNTNELRERVAKKECDENSLRERNSTISKQIEEYTKQIEEVETNFQEKKRDLISRLLNDEKLEAMFMQDVRDARAEMGTDSERSAQLAMHDQNLQKLKSNMQKLNTSLFENKKLRDECNAKIQDLNKEIDLVTNVERQKLQRIERKYPDEYQAVKWLQENGQLFTGTVYKPMILELNVVDSKYAKYFENTIAERDLRAFGCEHKSDVSILTNELIVKRKLRINVFHVPSADKCEYTPQKLNASLEQCGFIAYLLELIEGPPAILNYLCRLYKLHEIPIGTEEVNKHTDDIPKHIFQYYGGEQKYVVSISKYSKESSTTKHYVKGRDLLSTFVDTTEVQMLEKSRSKFIEDDKVLRAKCSLIQEDITKIQSEWKSILALKQDIEKKQIQIKHLENKLEKQQRKILDLKNNIDALPEIEKDSSRRIQNYLRSVMKLQHQNVETLKIYQKAVAERRLDASKICIYQQQNQELSNAFHESNEKMKDAQNKVDANIRELKTFERKKLKLSEAKHPDLNDESSSLTMMCNDLPNNLEEIKEEINLCKARLECMKEVDQGVVAEHDEKTRDIKSLRESIAANMRGEKDIESEISSIYEKWYPEIDRVINTLNRTFSDFMQSMSCVGEILLATKDQFDFDSYGIDIKVQYRKNVALETLDRNRQSGGERAVAIAVFTLSLQHITHVPFCCVDEINQGMDAKNERKIFEMLVKETTKTGRAQYFFVTPKSETQRLQSKELKQHFPHIRLKSLNTPIEESKGA